MSIYEEIGYVNRKEYLYSLAEEYDVGVSEVFALAEILGDVEDFDGLISALEDMQ